MGYFDGSTDPRGVVRRARLGDGTPLIMFFYGTLKRGERNHERFCGGVLRIEEGAVRGDVYDLAFGYPALVVPGESIHAFGTGDFARDVEEQWRLGREPVSLLEGPRVSGEIFAFDDPESRLRPSTTWKASIPSMRRATTGAYCSPSRQTRTRSYWRGPTWSKNHQEATCLEAAGHPSRRTTEES